MGNKLIKGVNDLATIRPDLAKEWHPTKNGDLKPSDVMPGSHLKVWWFLSYDDPKTSKHFDFEWQASIANRNKGNGCPYLSGRDIYVGFNDLATCNPQLASEWHPTKNGNLTPFDVMSNSNKKVWWYLSYDTEDDRHFDFEWQAVINSRNSGIGCPFLSGHQVWKGFNDLASCNPQLAKEWHPTKNGSLKPSDVTCNSLQKVWWLFPYDDLNTGKHFDFEWQTTVSHRVNNEGCPFLSNHRIWSGFNDLASVNPQLASEWHPTKNGNLTPSDVTYNSSQKVWWLLPYDDPKTGKHFDFEWETTILLRNNGIKCPFLSKFGRNIQIWHGFNDLASVNPQLASEWHPTKNGSLKPSDVTCNSLQKVWWYLPYDDPKTGKHFDFEWQATIKERNNGRNCPFLSGQQVLSGFNDLATVNPQLAKEWHPTKNGDLKPSDVTCGTNKKVWWLLPYDDPKTGKHFDFEWQATISHRHNGASCPFISASNPEIFIYDILRKLKINFQAEKTFRNCKNKKELPFDIYIPSKNLLIEFDGEQHFKNIDFFGGLKSFKSRNENDNIKNKYCLDNNIPILRIPYIYDIFLDKDKIEQIILKFITTKQVPKEIIDFYAKYKFSNYVECILQK